MGLCLSVSKNAIIEPFRMTKNGLSEKILKNPIDIFTYKKFIIKIFRRSKYSIVSQ